MHLAISEQVLGVKPDAKIVKEDDLLPMPRLELIVDIEKQGFKVQSLRAESSQGLRHFYLVLSFKSLDDVARSDLFGGRKVSFKSEGEKWLFRQEIVVSEKTLTDRAGAVGKEAPKTGPEGKKEKPAEESAIKQLETRFGKERVRQMFATYSIIFSVELPGTTLIRTNGVNHRDTAAVWETRLDQLIETKPRIVMEADFAGAPITRGKKP
jgi:hypothetical protein